MTWLCIAGCKMYEIIEGYKMWHGYVLQAVRCIKWVLACSIMYYLFIVYCLMSICLSMPWHNCNAINISALVNLGLHNQNLFILMAFS